MIEAPKIEPPDPNDDNLLTIDELMEASLTAANRLYLATDGLWLVSGALAATLLGAGLSRVYYRDRIDRLFYMGEDVRVFKALMWVWAELHPGEPSPMEPEDVPKSVKEKLELLESGIRAANSFADDLQAEQQSLVEAVRTILDEAWNKEEIRYESTQALTMAHSHLRDGDIMKVIEIAEEMGRV